MYLNTANCILNNVASPNICWKLSRIKLDYWIARICTLYVFISYWLSQLIKLSTALSLLFSCRNYFKKKYNRITLGRHTFIACFLKMPQYLMYFLENRVWKLLAVCIHRWLQGKRKQMQNVNTFFFEKVGHPTMTHKTAGHVNFWCNLKERCEESCIWVFKRFFVEFAFQNKSILSSFLKMWWEKYLG